MEIFVTILFGLLWSLCRGTAGPWFFPWCHADRGLPHRPAEVRRGQKGSLDDKRQRADQGQKSGRWSQLCARPVILGNSFPTVINSCLTRKVGEQWDPVPSGSIQEGSLGRQGRGRRGEEPLLWRCLNGRAVKASRLRAGRAGLGGWRLRSWRLQGVCHL